MKITKNIVVPTGNICIAEGEKGLPIEFLSIGDYGKDKNVKADFLGITREINGVPHGDLLPLEEKWVITISTQYSCRMNCAFCDVPKANGGQATNATFWDMVNQVMLGIGLHPEVKRTKRLNVHYARMGEPTFNRSVIDSAIYLAGMLKSRSFGFHPVVSTMMPKALLRTGELQAYLRDWMNVKNNILKGEAGLQLSINTTDETIREKLFAGNSISLAEMEFVNDLSVRGRKIALNFALTDAPVEAEVLARHFDPMKFMCKITPMHITNACKENGLLTKDGYEQFYPYKKVEEELKRYGFDVIVFIPSKEEDESRITCGNAILADKGE